MKTFITVSRAWTGAIFLLIIGSCSKDVGLSDGSYLNPTPPAQNAVDQWITENFTKPYNIEVVYRWREALVQRERYLYPPTLDSVKPALNIVKKLWIEPYSSVADPYIVNKVAPRQIVLAGGVNNNPSGTRTLGVAEAGKRITLFEVDLLAKANREAIAQFIHTIQHEYVHILNQTKPFDEQSYGKITPEGYTAQWFNESLAGSRNAGFITAYARANEREDFAEMASAMLLRSRREWNTLISRISEPGKSKIKQKEQLVAEYYKNEYGIDLYQLQEAVYQATLKLL